MANTTTITPFKVDKLEEGLFNATIQIVVNDGPEEIFSFTASKKYRKEVDVEVNLEAMVKPVLRNKIKTAWDEFVAKEQQERDMLESNKFATLCSDLQDEFDLYINQV